MIEVTGPDIFRRVLHQKPFSAHEEGTLVNIDSDPSFAWVEFARTKVVVVRHENVDLDDNWDAKFQPPAPHSSSEPLELIGSVTDPRMAEGQRPNFVEARTSYTEQDKCRREFLSYAETREAMEERLRQAA